MSFYGDIKRIRSSPYIFDKYYPNRKAMEDNCPTDNVYIGRYVLVKYTYSDDVIYNKINKDIMSNIYSPNKYYLYENGEYILCTDEDYNATKTYYEKTHYFNKYVSNKIDAENNPIKEINQAYQNNVDIDIGVYQDTFDATVWQKIYTNVTNDDGKTTSIEKYILIAELNAAVPRLTLANPLMSPKYKDATGEYWNSAKILETASSEDSYVFNIPETLHLDVGDMGDDFYGQKLINPFQRIDYEDIDIPTEAPKDYNGEKAWADLSKHEKIHYLALRPEYNYATWINQRYQGVDSNNKPIYTNIEDTDYGNIDGKQLDMKLYAFGQLISDLYDALYGVPQTESGMRPFYTDNMTDILAQYDKGLIGILSSIATDSKGDASQDLWNRSLQPGLYYYFVSKWIGADEDPDTFIENIPKVIGSTDEKNKGKSHYSIDYSNWRIKMD